MKKKIKAIEMWFFNELENSGNTATEAAAWVWAIFNAMGDKRFVELYEAEYVFSKEVSK